MVSERKLAFFTISVQVVASPCTFHKHVTQYCKLLHQIGGKWNYNPSHWVPIRLIDLTYKFDLVMAIMKKGYPRGSFFFKDSNIIFHLFSKAANATIVAIFLSSSKSLRVVLWLNLSIFNSSFYINVSSWLLTILQQGNAQLWHVI